MQTLERLCKCKDIVDMIYRYVHALMTAEVIHEYKVLSKEKYTHDTGITSHKLFYDHDQLFHNSINGYFNWRHNSDAYKWQIYHVSHKTRTVRATDFCTCYHTSYYKFH